MIEKKGGKKKKKKKLKKKKGRRGDDSRALRSFLPLLPSLFLLSSLFLSWKLASKNKQRREKEDKTDFFSSPL